MAHQVVWEKVNVFGDGDGATLLKRGDYVPDFVDAYQRSTLTSIGAFKAVEDVEESPAPEPDTPQEPPADEAPKGNASREEWAAYAASKGAPEDETKPVEEGGLKQTELRDKYGK